MSREEPEIVLSVDIQPQIKLSRREKDVLSLTACGKTRFEIAIILSISEETVKAYLKRICSKFGAINKTQAAALAVGYGFIAIEHRFPPGMHGGKDVPYI